jgi:type IV pilus assembly protein PilC
MAGHHSNYDASGMDESQAFYDKPVVREYSTYITDEDASKMCQLFADGLETGAGYARIFDFMERQKLDSKMVARLRYAVLDQGDRLGEAFARLGLLDAPARKLVLVAEEQAALPQTFKQLGRIYAHRLKQKKRVFFGMVEVFILTLLGGIIFPSVFIAGMQADAKEVKGAIFEALYVGALQSLTAAAVVGILFYIWINLPVEFSARSAIRSIWIRITFISQASRLASVSTFCRYFKQSLTSGLDMYRSIELAAEAADSPFIYGRTDQALDAVEAGYPLDAALGTIPGLPEEVCQHIGIGEETGRLEERLQHLTERYDELSVEAFDRTIAAIVYLVRVILITVIIGGALYLAATSMPFI